MEVGVVGKPCKAVATSKAGCEHTRTQDLDPPSPKQTPSHTSSSASWGVSPEPPPPPQLPRADHSIKITCPYSGCHRRVPVSPPKSHNLPIMLIVCPYRAEGNCPVPVRMRHLFSAKLYSHKSARAKKFPIWGLPPPNIHMKEPSILRKGPVQVSGCRKSNQEEQTDWVQTRKMDAIK